MNWHSVTFAAVMFADCVVVWAAAVNFGQFVDDAAAVEWAAAVLPAVTVWNDVVELPAAAASAAVALTSLASVAVAACFAVYVVCGYAVELVHVGE